MKLLKELLKDIEPSQKEETLVFSKINVFLDKLNKNLKGAKAILGGSGAKGTWLSKPVDVDIFVQFDYKAYENKDLSDILEKILKKRFSGVKRLNGSRDYFQIKFKNFVFEVIPILKIKKASEAKNITDISPLHAEWVVKNSDKRLGSEIRLTKAFCKAQDCYGAESYIMGFSGYVCEVVTIYYGSFLNLLKNAVKWKHKEVIDIKNYYKNKDALKSLNISKIQSPLIVIDPVQSDRNAAAALSLEKFQIFKDAAKNFLKKPSKNFFFKKELTLKELKQRAKNKKLILLEITPKRGKRDVVGSKLLKAFEHFKRHLRINDFKLYDSGWEWNKKSRFWFILDKKVLNAYKVHVGPPLKVKKHADKFKQKYRNSFVKNKRLFVKLKRDFRKPEELIKNMVKKDGYLKKKVKNIKIKR